jgi:predicted thioesterase
MITDKPRKTQNIKFQYYRIIKINQKIVSTHVKILHDGNKIKKGELTKCWINNQTRPTEFQNPKGSPAPTKKKKKK